MPPTTEPQTLTAPAEQMLADFERGWLQADEADEIAARLWMVERTARAEAAVERVAERREQIAQAIHDATYGPLYALHAVDVACECYVSADAVLALLSPQPRGAGSDALRRLRPQEP